MHVILTHEQADFDALASMLGAYLLDETAVPVLPRRINRNAYAFLTLYGRDLPFVEARDLPPGSIDILMLVDTQSHTTLKGMSDRTQVFVVDHHPARDDLDPSWNLQTEDLGATTTIFVESLHEQGTLLNPIQATLLLLGIYEDTGSLTYARTTPRDIRAAALLLEWGASLEITTSFLRHPLTLSQQALFDRLRESAEVHKIHGHQVILACGDAQDMEEEVSTIAHKLRDLLEPDALFMLVTTRGGVQLVARSTNDQVDVGEIASLFHGGGHDRAAAALIRPDEWKGDDSSRSLIDSVREELLRMLPDHIRPAITVGQIMSREPQVISPNTPASDVARRMQRFGYEGYPVVDRGQVIGLITRRSVDRALSHKLDKPAVSLMMAGEVTVSPDDSIEHLQNLMIDTGWGQIPVVEPETGGIIGIVTRTDLIHTLAPVPVLPGVENLASRMETALPRARQALIRAAAEAAYRQRDALYLVGGFVRDLLLDQPSADFDLVVEGDAIKLAHALAREFGGRVTSHSRFGTAKWHIGHVHQQLAKALRASMEPGGGTQALDPVDLPDALDLVTARTEFYAHPTALPTVERGSIKLDLHRRDFTINTLAVRLDGAHYGELYDYWGGLGDLRQGEVRVLHSLSFVDDPTRMLRAVRFEVRFGFQIESRTLELLHDARRLLGRVSGDRIRHELDAILDEAQAPRMLVRLADLRLLAAIHPDLAADGWLIDKIGQLRGLKPAAGWLDPQEASSPSWKRRLAYSLWLLRLEPQKARGVSQRLRFSAGLIDLCVSASGLRVDLPALVTEPPSKIALRLERAPPSAIYANYLGSDQDDVREVLETYVLKWRTIMPLTSGDDLRARGLPPGPRYREILEALRAAWLDGSIGSEEEEIRMLEHFLAETGAGNGP
jgi:tRNA nucleotidyltransferase (CCA-adding enzyme)